MTAYLDDQRITKFMAYFIGRFLSTFVRVVRFPSVA